MRANAIKNPIKKFIYLNKRKFQKIFSIRNSDDRTEKVVTLFGMKFRYKNH